MGIRSFLAFELPPDMKKTLSGVSAELRALPLDVRWVRVDNIHLTVIFIGDVAPGLLTDIGEHADHVCSRYGPFRMGLSGIGFFGGRRSPRVIWAGVTGDVERMSHFRDGLLRRLLPCGIRSEERRFTPHLTLGRFKRGGPSTLLPDDVVSRYGDVESRLRPVRELVLFRSDLTPGGAQYTRLAGWALKGGL